MLLAIDLSNLVIRHAANPYNQHLDYKSRPVGGAVGSISQIINLIEEIQPTHMILARDGHRSDIFRTKIDAGYKSHRPKADETIKNNFKATYKSLEVLNWNQLSVPSYEADDIIGSAARQFDGKVTIVSGDKDLLALCDTNISVRLLRPGGHIDCGPDECFDIMGVFPNEVCDYKALVGDSSDGITGIPGIGPKRAIQIIKDYGNIANLFVAIDNLKKEESLPGFSKKVSDLVVSGRDSAKTSYQLAKIVEDLEIDFDSCPSPDIASVPVLDSAQSDELFKMGLGKIVHRLNKIDKDPEPPAKKLEDVFDSALNF